MSNLVNKTEELNKQTEELLNNVIKQAGFESFKNMDEKEFVLFRDCMRLMDAAKEYQMEAAKVLDKIDTIEKQMETVIKQLNYISSKE